MYSTFRCILLSDVWDNQGSLGELGKSKKPEQSEAPEKSRLTEDVSENQKNHRNLEKCWNIKNTNGVSHANVHVLGYAEKYL